ncbi:NAD(P)/FAD-dependent oxidoreductase [Lichenihabitans psoromatis]|uniref:NAD(P)/FAD-dependent oxidoreductase n=1 Tax=Lichenihabitans psoromatis TaxID=2528642 RepID=UPI0010385D20|nr:FAD-dependent oxidoreductase [Lichenihabitans psoromatis]
MSLKADVAVLGAGIVGVSAALHLQKRGRDVVMIDRRGGAGEETSYGNAGLIERSSLFPYSFPREWGTLVRYAQNRSTDAHYHASALTVVAPWLARYYAHSSPEGIAQTFTASKPLIERSLIEHEALMEEAGATHLLRKVGWIKAFRTETSLAKGLAEAEKLRRYDLAIDTLDGAGIAEREPHVGSGLIGGLHFKDPGAVSDPGALVRAYATLFMTQGGRFLQGDAKTLSQNGSGWQIATEDGLVMAREVVVALGPWADDIFRPLGYDIPLGIKRGYHLHFRPKGNAVLNRPILDVDGGFLLAPMSHGIRLTTGAEFARRDTPQTPVQIARAEPKARALFPLAEAIEAKPWMGARPCLPDMLPVIGEAPRHPGLWFDFGHQHHGLTLGPVTGRLLAELITGETPFTDPRPYQLERFV